MKSVLRKIITSHRFSLIILLFVQWTGLLLQNYFPKLLNISLFTGGSLGLGIALLLIYFNKAVGFNTSGQQQGVKIRQLITLAGFTAIAFMFYLLLPAFSLSGQSYADWLPIISWAFVFILFLIRSGKYNSALYHLLTLLYGLGIMWFLCIHSNPLTTIFFDPAAVLLVAYYMLLVLSFNIHKPVIRGIIMGFGLLTAGFIPLFWLIPVLIILWMNEAKRHFRSMMIAFIIVAGSICLLAYAGMKYWPALNNMGYSNLLSFPFVVTMLSAVAMLILYSRIRKLIDYRIFLMASLKICMALFLLFNCLPPGLVLIDLFVSIAIFSETGKYHFAGVISERTPHRQD